MLYIRGTRNVSPGPGPAKNGSKGISSVFRSRLVKMGAGGGGGGEGRSVPIFSFCKENRTAVDSSLHVGFVLVLADRNTIYQRVKFEELTKESYVPVIKRLTTKDYLQTPKRCTR